MLILLALVFAAAAGTALHFVLPYRSTRGAALAPLTATAIAAVVYTSMTWLGLAEDNPLMWATALVIPTLLTALFIGVLSRSRDAHDTRERARLHL